MIPRTATLTLQRLAKGFPIIALTGPRQSGKTTLAKQVFADKAYVSLENPDEHEFAERDPRAFLKRFESGAILDEVQRCPHLLSWLQGLVDERGRMGDFVLTGSAQFDLISGITQSLAGRVGRIELLPFSGAELAAVGKLPDSLEDMLLRGAYPALYDRELLPRDWFPYYVTNLPGARCPPAHRRARLVAISALCAHVRGALRPTAQSGGAGRGLRHLCGHGARVAVGAGGQLPGGAIAAVPPQFWQATGQKPQAVFFGRRAHGLAAGHSRRRQHPDPRGPWRTV